MSHEQAREFLDSLEPEKGLPNQIKYAKLNLERLSSFGKEADDMAQQVLDVLSSLESRQIPDLKERVKELVRDAMDVASNHDDKWNYCTLIKDLRDLCAPEEVKP